MKFDSFLLVYYFAGVIQDFLLTLNWRYVAKEKALLASVFSFSTMFVTMVVLYNIFTRLDNERSILAIIVYSLGVCTGTFLGVKMKIGKKL